MIRFLDVHKSYRVDGKDIPALQPFNLEIADGEVFGIIGHSGAGKSTLIRLINLLERPSGGRILIDDVEMTALDEPALRAQRRRIGMIFQHFNLLASQTVSENIAFPMRLAGQTDKAVLRQRVNELLARVGLSAHADKYPSQLSGGQKQRVGIARALANRPSILLCDEATSALDPQTTASVLELLAEINRELKLTIVLITHEMDVVRRIGDRVAVLDAGRIVEQGTVADVFLHPQHPTTRRFVGDALPEEAASEHAPLAQVPGRILRLSFRGESTWTPTLSRVMRETGVDFNLIAGRIDRIKNLPYGQLTLAMEGPGVDTALAALRAGGIEIEEVTPTTRHTTTPAPTGSER
ncbi:MAG: methionine ABC transporter ATP-binding protein [Rhodanobacter sp.]